MTLPFDKPLLNSKEEFENRFKNIYNFKVFFDELHIDRQKELIMLHNYFLTGETLGDFSRKSLINIESLLIGIADRHAQRYFNQRKFLG